MSLRSALFILLGCLLGCMVNAQSFENLKITPQGNKITITYDLLGGKADQTFSVELYGSHNNFSSPIQLATGDVGKKIKPGINKTMEWDMLAELKSYSGEIAFELRGQPEIEALSFRNPKPGSSVRKGKTTNIQWQGGSGQSTVHLELYQGGQLISALGDKPNNGSFAWAVPPDILKGKNFTLRMTSGQETAVSEAFAIKPKVSILLKLAPIVVVGAIIPFLIPKPPAEPDLPGAPAPN